MAKTTLDSNIQLHKRVSDACSWHFHAILNFSFDIMRHKLLILYIFFSHYAEFSFSWYFGHFSIKLCDEIHLNKAKLNVFFVCLLIKEGKTKLKLTI